MTANVQARTRVRGIALGPNGERIAVRGAEAEEQSPPGTDLSACRGLRLLVRWLLRQHTADIGRDSALPGPAADEGKPGHSPHHRALTRSPTRALMSGDD